MAASTHAPDLHALLREQFGFDAFRPGQERIIRGLLAKRDVLAVLPTGAGKSLVFQLASSVLPGATLVVSPLIALMKDQADFAEEHGFHAGVVNSAQPAGQVEQDLQDVQRRETKLLYVTPERFRDAAFMERMQQLRVSLFVVDEAHCISEWGHDFRPAYFSLRDAAERLGRPSVLALTATATPWVRRDIIERLGLREPDLVVRGVDRPNLFFEVRKVEREEEDYRVLHRLLTEREEEYPEALSGPLSKVMQGSGIVYTATTRGAEETAGWMREWGIPADSYHGQRRKSDRERVQEAFMAGELRAIAATNAFGMGIDKPDVRWVVHRDVPASVEEYYQEAGRAGRDGELARCMLIYRRADLGRAAFLSGSSRISREDVEEGRRALLSVREGTLAELAETSSLGKGKLRRLLDLFQREGIVEVEGERLRLLTEDFNPARISLEAEENRRAFERSRLQMMQGYADTWDCRRVYLLSYFGEDPGAERCGHCDNDVTAAEAGTQADTGDPLAPGRRVAHEQWGAGTVLDVSEETVTVRFDAEGEKKLGAALVRERNLLQPLAEPPRSSPAAAEAAREVHSADGETLRHGERVVHAEHGAGEIQRVTEDAVTVLFETVGYKTLAKDAVEERGLLHGEEEEAQQAS